jgi:excisionase family DNA binding protein
MGRSPKVGSSSRALSISERTLFTLTQRGEIPAVRIGRAVRYEAADLQAYIVRRKDGAR